MTASNILDVGLDNQKHKELLVEMSSEIMNKVDSLPLHSKNKILLYSRYFMSKISWHLTIADIEPTWVVSFELLIFLDAPIFLLFVPALFLLQR